MGLGFYTPLLNMSRGFLFAQSLRLIIVYTTLQMNLAQFPVFHLRSIKHPQPNKDIIIRQRREVTAMGITRVRELCAQGYIDQSGVFRLKRCVGRYGPKEPCKTANPVITNRAA